jgi:hypothetical protein
MFVRHHPTSEYGVGFVTSLFEMICYHQFDNVSVNSHMIGLNFG